MSEQPPWRVELTSPAAGDLGRIPPRYSTAIVEFLTAVLPTNPPRLGEALRNELEGMHSARRGDYRVLSRINHDEHAVFVARIDHRGRLHHSR